MREADAVLREADGDGREIVAEVDRRDAVAAGDGVAVGDELVAAVLAAVQLVVLSGHDCSTRTTAV